MQKKRRTPVKSHTNWFVQSLKNCAAKLIHAFFIHLRPCSGMSLRTGKPLGIACAVGLKGHWSLLLPKHFGYTSITLDWFHSLSHDRSRCRRRKQLFRHL